jgi:uracil-DNA glycosylase family 4
MALQDLHERILRCDKCQLRSGCSRVVPGDGAEVTNTMFIGEGPGETEDTQGKPFVGRSGMFLRGTMETCGILPSSVYITNTVRCRPPDNRDPTPEETEACWPWTAQLLKQIKPKVIVTLGRPSLATIARKIGLSKKVGQLSITKLAGIPLYSEEYGVYLFPMLHPAYALRRNEARQDFEGHMKYLKMAIPGWVEG